VLLFLPLLVFPQLAHAGVFRLVDELALLPRLDVVHCHVDLRLKGV
jgi:hypothetical protein